MNEAMALLERERERACNKAYEFMGKIKEGEHSRKKLKQLEQHRDFYQNAELTITRIIELLKKEGVK
jgi:hypothetical protein